MKQVHGRRGFLKWLGLTPGLAVVSSERGPEVKTADVSKVSGHPTTPYLGLSACMMPWRSEPMCTMFPPVPLESGQTVRVRITAQLPGDGE